MPPQNQINAGKDKKNQRFKRGLWKDYWNVYGFVTWAAFLIILAAILDLSRVTPIGFGISTLKLTRIYQNKT